MSRLLSRLAALTLLGTLVGTLAAADEKAEPVKLAKVSETQGTGGIVSPDGKLLAVTVIQKHEVKRANGMSSGSYHQVRLLDAATAKELAVIPGASVGFFRADGKVLCVHQSFDEQFIKAGNIFGSMAIMAMPQLWDVSNPQKPKQLFVIDGASRESFSPDGKLFLVAGGPEQKFGNAGKVVAGLPKTGNKGGAVGGGGAPGIGGGGGLFFNGISLRFFEIWDVESAKFIARYEPQPKGKAGVSDPVFSPDGKQVAAVVTNPQGKGINWKIAVYDVTQKKETRLIDLGDAKVLQSGGLMGEAMPQSVQWVPLREKADGSSASQMTGYALAAAIGTADGVELNLYDPATGKQLATLLSEKKKADTTVQLQFDVSPDGKSLAAVLQRRTPPPFGGGMRPVGGAGAFGGVGGGGIGGAAPVPGGFGGAKPNPPPAGGGAGGFGAFGGMGGAAGGFPAGGGVRLFVPPASGEVVLIDLEKRAKTHTLAVLPQNARFTNDRTLATINFGDNAMNLKLWDVAAGKEIGAQADVNDVHASADGAALLTRANDVNAPAVRLWKVDRAK